MVVRRGYPCPLQISWKTSREERVVPKKEQRPGGKKTCRILRADSSMEKQQVPHSVSSLKIRIHVREIMRSKEQYPGLATPISFRTISLADMKIIAVARPGYCSLLL